MTRPKSALVVCYSTLRNDPRVLKQIGWLVSAGYRVDTLGLGGPPDMVTKHFEICDTKNRSRILSGLSILFLPNKAKFKFLTQTKIPEELTRSADNYDLVVVNEIDLLPWVSTVMSSSKNTKTHWNLDLHEYHEFEFPPDIPVIFRRPLRNYFAWKREMIGELAFDSYSTVASGIARLYSNEFEDLRFELIYNSKPYEALNVSEVRPDRIELLYHGLAQMERGLDVLLAATPLLDKRFRVSMMLTGPESLTRDVRKLARAYGADIEWLSPVSMSEVSERINVFDLEIIFYPPKTMNLLYAFPNKFFEAVQGRLGLVIGDSPSMREEVRRFGNGFVVRGWNPEDLANFINSLEIEDIRSAKLASDFAASQLSLEKDRKKFLAQFC